MSAGGGKRKEERGKRKKDIENKQGKVNGQQ